MAKIKLQNIAFQLMGTHPSKSYLLPNTGVTYVNAGIWRESNKYLILN